MIFEIEINGKPVKVKKGETILEVLGRIGINVPTLCSMKGYTPTGMCRMCVVEIEGKENLIPSCSFKVEEWMKIKTHSPRVVQARKTIVELLLANHPDDCLFCERNGNCELQKHAEDLHVREKRIKGNKPKFYIDNSSVSIVHEPSKCISCGRCIRVCNENIGVSTLDISHRGLKIAVEPALNKPINFSNCLHCGQCIMVCPTSAFREKINFSELQVIFHDLDKKIVAIYSPAVAITLAEEFNIKPGKDLDGILTAVLKKIGFDKVIDSSFGTDLAIMESTFEFVSRLEKGGPFPMLTSCCPSWVKYLEQTYPMLLPNLVTTKSSQQIMGSVIKSFYAEKEKLNIENLHVVAIMPCTARKYEASRSDMTNKGISDVDAVITTRELIRMIRMYGIDINSIEPEPIDEVFSNASSAGKLINVSGGTMEATLRTIYHQIIGSTLNDNGFANFKGTKGVKEAKIKMGNHELGVAVVNGLVNVKQLINEILTGRCDIHFVEVMTCQGGCIAGGGQPINSKVDTLKLRAKSIYDFDEKDVINAAHLNPKVLNLYKEYFEGISNPRNIHILHSSFSKKEVLI